MKITVCRSSLDFLNKFPVDISVSIDSIDAHIFLWKKREFPDYIPFETFLSSCPKEDHII
jgi:hypothetical protein